MAAPSAFPPHSGAAAVEVVGFSGHDVPTLMAASCSELASNRMSKRSRHRKGLAPGETRYLKRL